MGAHHRSARWGALLLVGTGLVGSCSSQAPDLGGLMLAIGQDGPLPINRLDIEVEYAGNTLRKSSFRVPEEAELPTTLAIASNGDPTAGVKIVVIGWNGDLPLDRRDAIVTQVPSDRVARLDIVLSGRCSKRVMLEADGTASSTCGEGRTCAPTSGNCTDADVDAKSLPSYQSGDEEQLGAGGSQDAGGAGNAANGGSAGSSGSGGVAGSGSGVGGEGAEAGGGSLPLAGAGGNEPVGMAGASGAGGAEPTAVCGDGVVGSGEACDDRNHDYGDGCTGSCRQIEAQYACNNAGQACAATAVCGNATLETPFETCDDGNALDADGCSATCQLENGFKCSRPGAGCNPIVGDGILSGSETCDDTNQVNNDGCSAGQIEPGYACPTVGQKCTLTVCGNATPEGLEGCDDGNNDAADGCTPTCTRVPICPNTGGVCAPQCGDGFVVAAEECDDGNLKAGDGCSAVCKREPGFQCVNQFASLSPSLSIVYRDFVAAAAGGSTQHPDFQTFNTGIETGLVKPNLNASSDPVFSGTCMFPPCPITSAASFDQWFKDVPGVNLTSVSSLSLTNVGAGALQFSSAAFFPLDNKGWISVAKEATLSAHNFGFTSEARFWFQYQGGEVIDFTGDDDVWIFVAGKLAGDLGGVHAALNAGVTLNSLGLTLGGLYDVAIFQAERHTNASNYKLTLQGFGSAKSICVPQCGDGVRNGAEECDAGAAGNIGGYGHCAPDCKLGPGCGDGVKQAPEACDVGAAAVTYAGCAADCTSRTCGDGKVQADFEQCDDSNTTPGDGCSATCQEE